MATSNYSLHPSPKKFFDPLRTNDSRNGFFTVYRKEFAEFDRDCSRKYDEDLNTSLILCVVCFPHPALNAESGSAQAGLFSAVRSAFIIDVQSNLRPVPNEMTAAYMRILIHAVNGSPFPDAN